MSKLFSVNFLEDKILEDVQFLIDISNKNDKVDLSCPINEEGTKYFLIYEKEILISVLCLYMYTDKEYDCIAFTLPRYRKKGYFKRLLAYATDYLIGKKTKEDISLNFSIYPKLEASKNTLKSVDAIYSKTETFMSLDLSIYKNNDEKANEDIKIIRTSELGDYEEYSIKYNEKKIGEFYLLKQGENIYFYGLEIYKNYRNKGYASLGMKKILRQLKSKGYKMLYLQVCIENEVAYNIYSKLGFKIDKSLEMYYIVVK